MTCMISTFHRLILKHRQNGSLKGIFTLIPACFPLGVQRKFRELWKNTIHHVVQPTTLERLRECYCVGVGKDTGLIFWSEGSTGFCSEKYLSFQIMKKCGYFPTLYVWTSRMMRQKIWWTSREKTSRKLKAAPAQQNQCNLWANGQTLSNTFLSTAIYCCWSSV